MNLFNCTARIIKTPILLLYKQKPFTQMILCVHNNKKKSLWYFIYTKATGRLANHIFNIYNEGDFVIINGYINTKSKQVRVDNHLRTKKFINIKINKIYPIKKI